MSSKRTGSDKGSSKRILALDLLRGFFLVSIILNHLQWYPSGYDIVAFRGSLLVSAAEGFFLISGIILGIVRGRKLINEPFKKSALLILARGARLYITAIVLMLLFTFIGWLFIDNPGLKPGIRPIDQPFGEILVGALTFQYIYGWADFLRLYAIFMIMAPFALWLLRRGKWYILMAISVALWALFPYALETSGQSGELLMVLSWQLIFFTGFTIGFYRDEVASLWRKLAATTRNVVPRVIIIVAAATLFINILVVTSSTLGILTPLTNLFHTSVYPLFNKEQLTLARLALFALWFTLGFYIFHRYESIIVKWFGWVLLPFGSNSLYVYILHAIVLLFAHLIIPAGSSANVIINAVGSTVILGLILLAVRKRFLFKIIPQ